MLNLRTFLNLHKGKSAIVCGTGLSLSAIIDHDTDKVILIGLNGAGAYCYLDYLLIKDQLNLGRKYGNPDLQSKVDSIRDNKCEQLFCKHVPIGYKKHNIVEYEVVPIDLENPGRVLKLNKLWGGNESFLAGLSLAIYMGCERVGMLGIDWCTPDVFGDYTVRGYWEDTRKEGMESILTRMMEWSALSNIEIVNLSERSKLESVPKSNLVDFLDGVV